MPKTAQDSVAVDTLGRLRRLEAEFEGVSEVPDPLAWLDSWIPTRLDGHFREAVRLGEVILRNLTVTHLHGSVSISAFLIGMNMLVEDFVTDQLRARIRAPFAIGSQEPAPFDTAGSVTA
ncbi:MAG: hypothetical protein WAT65_03760, partial [Candidatus Nanopelagicales bacterium]